MHEIVIVLSDLYLQSGAADPALNDMGPPGLAHVLRFAGKSSNAEGWRAWLARWISGPADGLPVEFSPATVASAAIVSRPGGQSNRESADAATRRMDEPTGAPALPATVWMASPVHLFASLASLHLDRHGLLRLSAAERFALATDFRATLGHGGFRLQPLDSGDFLLIGPADLSTRTTEPQRLVGENVAQFLTAGADAAVLRRLSGEIEMWLHDHPVNEARRNRGELPVSTFWFWGAGPVATASAIASSRATTPDPLHSTSADLAFGEDAFLFGLWAQSGQTVRPLPQQLQEVLGYPHARRAVLVLEVARMLTAQSQGTWLDSLAQIDRRFLSPALQALRAGAISRLVLLANDHEWSLTARDRFRLWRPRRNLTGLR